MKNIKIILLTLLGISPIHSMNFLKKLTGKKAESKTQVVPDNQAQPIGHAPVIKQLIAAGKQNSEKYDAMLIEAAKKGDIGLVQEALKNKANIEVRDTVNQGTSLMWAAYNGHTAIVKLLLEAGADKEAKTQDQVTALHLAATNGHTEVVKILLAARADKEAKTQDQVTALHLAADNGHTAIVKLLLEAGADKEAKNQNQETALIFAAANGHPLIVKILLESGADKEAKDVYQNTALILAAFNGHTATVKLLLGAGADTEGLLSNGMPIINLLIMQNIPDLVPLLLQYGTLVARPLPEQVEIDAIRQILNLPSNDCLIMSTLLDNHLYVNNVLKQKPSAEEINRQDSKRMTALMWAAARGRVNIVKALLSYGKKNKYVTNALLTNDEDKTAFELARDNKHKKIMKYLDGYLKQNREVLAQLITQSVKIPEFLKCAEIIAQYFYGGL